MIERRIQIEQQRQALAKLTDMSMELVRDIGRRMRTASSAELLRLAKEFEQASEEVRRNIILDTKLEREAAREASAAPEAAPRAPPRPLSSNGSGTLH